VSALLTALGETPKISEEEFNTLFEDLDKDDNGTISRDEVTFFIRVAQGEEPMPVK
jgi:Ca2+-binding EF-hand superfamily protein